MNTPRKPKRYAYKPGLIEDLGNSIEFYNYCKDPNIQQRLGLLMSIWPHVEDSMILPFQILSGIDDIATASLILNSVISVQGRLKIIKQILHNLPKNMNAGPEFEEYMVRIEHLVDVRNLYAHGTWFTLKSDGRVFLARNEGFIINNIDKGKEISPNEIDEFLDEVEGFVMWMSVWRKRYDLDQVEKFRKERH